MPQDIFEDEIRIKQRPTFLTVLCILTFIGSGYGIINAAVTYFKADTVSEMVVEAKKKMSEDLKKDKDPEAEGFVTDVMTDMSAISTPHNLRKSSVGAFVSSLFCLLGAILMWRLRRVGFYSYILGTIIGIILPIYMFGSNFLTNISSGVQGFIGILFVIFYAMNLKSMKS